ncbi:MAG: hypothetical protein ACXWXQ_04945 [Actinomycetota bacterium]
MRTPSVARLRGIPAFGFAAAGLLIGHALSYALAIPDPHHRDLVLDGTGHAYLPAAGQVALVLALAGVAAIVVRSRSGRGPRDAEGFGALARLLAIVQVGAFAGQELLERVSTGSPVGELLHGRVFVVGVLVQVAVALGGAATLRLLARAADRIAHAPSTGVRLAGPGPCIVLSAAPGRPHARPARRQRNERAPPLA